MKAKGVVYQEGTSGTHGQIFLFLPVVVNLIYQIVRTLGASLITLAVVGFIFSYWPIFGQEISYELNRFGIGQDPEHISELAVQEVEADQGLAVQKEAEYWNVNSYFSLVIPKISASANIIANTDAGKRNEYLEALKKGVAHVKGTYFPGQDGTIFLFSHSTDSPLNFARYNAVFYLLRKLEKGDQISIFFADKEYKYNVVDKVTTKPDDVSWLTPKNAGEELILMTCDPPGTTLQRLLVIAKPE